ncbi:MAG: hypothetical protein ACM31C_01515 [Acidobacteriota bacterium]
MRGAHVAILLCACGGGGGKPADAPPGGDAAGDARASDAASDAPAIDPCTQPGAFGTWHAVSLTNAAPHPFAMVWTGSEVFAVNWETDTTIDAYDPAADTWRSVNVGTNGPAKRYSPFVAWANGKLFVWGGYTSSGGTTTNVYDGAVFDPGTSSWTPVTTTGAPQLRGGSDSSTHAYATGSLVLLVDDSHYDTDIAAVYDVSANQWVTIEPTTSAPILYGCQYPSWNGSSLACQYAGEVYRYDASPFAFATLPAAPSSSGGGHILTDVYSVWTDSKLFTWGGSDTLNAATVYGASLYDPGASSWTAATAAGAPSARFQPARGYLGNRVVIWGGQAYDPAHSGLWPSDRGAAYDPATDTWTPVSCNGAPQIEFPPHLVIPSGLFVFNGTAGAILSP